MGTEEKDVSEPDTSWLISGDWGTSTLRLRRVLAMPFQVAEDVERPWGIASVHEDWKAGGQERRTFFLARLADALAAFQGETAGLPIYLSGMAGSSVGIVEVPYAEVPFALGKTPPSLVLEPADSGFPNRVTLLSGLRWGGRDVMRGEETQVAGLCLDASLALPDAYTVILPGTHSKHVRVEGDAIVSFQTYLTGDLYEAIARHTLLRHSLSASRRVRDPAAFREGIAAAREEGLLASLFRIRCADLMGERGPKGNDAFLSGLLVGAELAPLASSGEALVLAEDDLGTLYLEALDVLDHPGRRVRVPGVAMRQAVPRGHAFVHRER